MQTSWFILWRFKKTFHRSQILSSVFWGVRGMGGVWTPPPPYHANSHIGGPPSPPSLIRGKGGWEVTTALLNTGEEWEIYDTVKFSQGWPILGGWRGGGRQGRSKNGGGGHASCRHLCIIMDPWRRGGGGTVGLDSQIKAWVLRLRPGLKWPKKPISSHNLT